MASLSPATLERGHGTDHESERHDSGRDPRMDATADAGRLAVDGAFTDLLSHEQLLLESLSDAERVELADLLRELMQQFTPSA